MGFLRFENQGILFYIFFGTGVIQYSDYLEKCESEITTTEIYTCLKLLIVKYSIKIQKKDQLSY